MNTREFGKSLGITYMAVENNEFEDIHGKMISEMGIKPILTLQEYEYKAAIAATVDRSKRTVKFEIRSSDAKYNCREFAQSVHPISGGHLQVAEDRHLRDVAESVIDQFVRYILQVDGITAEDVVFHGVEFPHIHDPACISLFATKKD